MQPKIVSVSLNPAIDVSLALESLRWGQENAPTREWYESAGKGANVARALTARKVPCPCVVVVGRHNAERFLSPLHLEGVELFPIFAEGATRENITLLLPGEKPTRIMRKGFVFTPDLLDFVRRQLLGLLQPGDILVLGGKLPQGLPAQEFVAFCKELVKATGAYLVLDTSSLTMQETMAAAPRLIKPNLQELEQLAGKALPTTAEQLREMACLQEGGIERVLLSLGAGGLLYQGPEGVRQVTVPDLPVVSTVGAGDCLLAEYLIRHHLRKQDLEGALRWAAASGTASCLREGTNPPHYEQMGEVFAQTMCSEVVQ